MSKERFESGVVNLLYSMPIEERKKILAKYKQKYNSKSVFDYGYLFKLIQEWNKDEYLEKWR